MNSQPKLLARSRDTISAPTVPNPTVTTANMNVATSDWTWRSSSPSQIAAALTAMIRPTIVQAIR